MTILITLSQERNKKSESHNEIYSTNNRKASKQWITLSSQSGGLFPDLPVCDRSVDLYCDWELQDMAKDQRVTMRALARADQ
jgi:hypothetical protein